MAAEEVGDGGEADGVGAFGGEQAEIETGVTGRLDFDVLGEGLRQIEEGVAVVNVGRVVQYRQPFVKLGPLSAFGQVKTICQKLFAGEQALEHGGRSGVTSSQAQQPGREWRAAWESFPHRCWL